MFDNLGISKCDSKKSPTVQNYEVISFNLTVICVWQIKNHIVTIWSLQAHTFFFSVSKSEAGASLDCSKQW